MNIVFIIYIGTAIEVNTHAWSAVIYDEFVCIINRVSIGKSLNALSQGGKRIFIRSLIQVDNAVPIPLVE